MSAFVTRFAPSPTGWLHLGHAFSALTAHATATAAGGRFLLRIEDIDRARCRPEHEAAIHEDLAWLGLDWETPVLRQSERLPVYAEALERLRAQGVLYRCFRTRREAMDAAAAAPQEPHEPTFTGSPLPPDEEAARLAAGGPYAWRLSMAAARARLGDAWSALAITDAGAGELRVDPAKAGDVVLGRKDLGVAYHLASVVDDAAQGVTHVIRGEDLRDAAPVHRLLQALLGLPAPTYRHHRLVLDAGRERLAKRRGSESLADLRGRGVTADQLRARLGF